MTEFGILAAGAYIPRTRLQRRAIAAAHAWFAPGLSSLAEGERSVAGWDEDAVTLAVEAARDCLHGRDRAAINRVVLASTSHPFADRQNAGIVKEALNLPDAVATLDVGGSQRAGSSALLDALQSARGSGRTVLCLAAEKRRCQPASELEFAAGDASAAFLVGDGAVAAEFLGGHSVTVDFVDHFRAAGQDFDYGWESRWVREEGYGRIAPEAIREAMDAVGLSPSDIDHFIMPSPSRGANVAVAKACGVGLDRVADTLAAPLGDAGCAQPLVMLARALETARAGAVLAVIGFGQGCDVLFFRATGRPAASGLGVSGWLARRKPELDYVRHLVIAGQLDVERGPRAEFDQKTALTALYRDRQAVMALVGGRCAKTGAVQFPKTSIAVGGGARAALEDYPFAERRARILTHTSDSLTYTPDPPCWYGAVEFEGGGRMTLEFVDVDPEQIEVGAPMRVMFRVKAVDERRGFKRYFWKATPDYLLAADDPVATAQET